MLKLTHNPAVQRTNGDGDVFNVTEADTEESAASLRSPPQRRTGGIPEGLPVSSGRGVCEERHTGTRKTLSVPDDRGGGTPSRTGQSGKDVRRAVPAHLPMIVFRQKTGACELVRSRGIYLNFKKNIAKATKNAEFTLNSGDILVLYTDGLTEAEDRDGKMLDLDGFVGIVETHAHRIPEAMKDTIMADVIQWCDDRRADDMTLVIVKRKED
ncbi:MAG: hypothetical protein B6245_09710 [Desulfobacteraceae bacterium 4572_88]|nr:MAG: hypothetical protein B6245_09710 [Desulfobacteraceae bacterium 4572_88]